MRWRTIDAIVVVTAVLTGPNWIKTVHAFGAGKIPETSWLSGKGFRHGDIDDVLKDWMKKMNRRPKRRGVRARWDFEDDDTDRVYFGNWLRDYSQIVDTKPLSIMDASVLNGMLQTFGFLVMPVGATQYIEGNDGKLIQVQPGGEYEITKSRVGVYLPVEHIDNPKGYPSDAQRYDDRLRPAVNPLELDIDPKSGMKNYIANDSGGWDTSRAYVRRMLIASIRFGRMYLLVKKVEYKYEAYRLLGAALHTLEDFSAHSNFCELTLIDFGYDVFPYVGVNTTIPAPTGKMVYPLVTGTFGARDFMHSILSEMSDTLSEWSITSLNEEVKYAEARQKSILGDAQFGTLASIQAQLHNITERVDQGNTFPISLNNEIRPDNMKSFSSRLQGAHAGSRQAKRGLDDILENITGRDPDDGGLLGDLLSLPSRLTKETLKIASSAVDNIMDIRQDLERLRADATLFVLKAIEPILTPSIRFFTQKLQELANCVLVSDEAQWDVFNNPSSTDPSHSLISKDHFEMILNEPAGNLGKIIVLYTANLVLAAWESSSDAGDEAAINDILKAFFHPSFHDSTSVVQKQMLGYMKAWINSHGEQPRKEILRRLSRSGILANENDRFQGYTTGAGLKDTDSHGGGGQRTASSTPGIAAFLRGKVVPNGGK